MPYQLSRILDKGYEGLNGYTKLLESIKTMLTKNNELCEQVRMY